MKANANNILRNLTLVCYANNAHGRTYRRFQDQPSVWRGNGANTAHRTYTTGALIISEDTDGVETESLVEIQDSVAEHI